MANFPILCHCDGTNGSQSFPNVNGSGPSLVVVGATSVTTAHPKFGTGAGDFNTAGGGGVGTALHTSTTLTFTGAFSVEMWVEKVGFVGTIWTIGQDGTVGGLRVSHNVADILVQATTSTPGTYTTLLDDGNTSFGAIGSGGGQHHFYVGRDGSGNGYAMVDGAHLSGSPFSGWTGTLSGQFILGDYLMSDGVTYASMNNGGSAGVYLDEIRVSDDTAVYTSTFTPPTGPFTLAADAVPFVPAAQLFATYAPSVVPLIKRVATTALVAAAGVYVPVGVATPAKQAAIAYREPARLPTQSKPVLTVGPAISSVPTPPPTPVIYREAPRLPIVPPIFAAPSAPSYAPVPNPVVTVPAAAWPYGALESWRLAPEPAGAQSGIVPAYAFSPTNNPVVEPPWPYLSATLPRVFTPGVSPPYALSPVRNPVVEPPWPYATFVTFPSFSPGVAPQYSFSPPVYPAPITPWPYAATLNPAPTASAFGLPGVFTFSPTLTPPVAASWPYAAFSLVEPTASEFAFSSVYTFSLPVYPGASVAWPYAAFSLVEPTASEFGAPAAYGGRVPVVQWLTYPAWPYAGTLIPAPTASMWGQAAPPPPIAPPGSNGLRRWVIQQYEAYFAERDANALLSKGAAKRVEKKRAKRPEPAYRAAPDDDYLEAAFRLANTLSAGSLEIQARVVRLEESRALSIKLPPVPAPREQHATDEDDMLLLALLFNEGL